jgi:hypothetical protein
VTGLGAAGFVLQRGDAGRGAVELRPAAGLVPFEPFQDFAKDDDAEGAVPNGFGSK